MVGLWLLAGENYSEESKGSWESGRHGSLECSDPVESEHLWCQAQTSGVETGTCVLFFLPVCLSLGTPLPGGGLTLLHCPPCSPLAGGHGGPRRGERPFPGPARGPGPRGAAVGLQQTPGLERGPRVAGGE